MLAILDATINLSAHGAEAILIFMLCINYSGICAKSIFELWATAHVYSTYISSKCRLSYCGYTMRNIDACKVTTIVECIHTNLCHTIWDGDSSQFHALNKCITFDNAESFVECYSFKWCAATESIRAYCSNTWRNNDISNANKVTKSIITNSGYTIANHNSRYLLRIFSPPWVIRITFVIRHCSLSENGEYRTIFANCPSYTLCATFIGLSTTITSRHTTFCTNAIIETCVGACSMLYGVDKFSVLVALAIRGIFILISFSSKHLFIIDKYLEGAFVGITTIVWIFFQLLLMIATPVEGVISRVVIVITHNTVRAAIFYSSYTYLLTILLHYNGIAVPAISCTIMHLDDNLRHIGGPYSGNGGVGLNGYVIAWLILILAYLPCLEHHTIGSSECTFGQGAISDCENIIHRTSTSVSFETNFKKWCPHGSNGGVVLNDNNFAWLILILAYLPCLEHHTLGSSECTFWQRILAIADAISHFVPAAISCKGDGVFSIRFFTDRIIQSVHNRAYRVSFAVEEAIALRQQDCRGTGGEARVYPTNYTDIRNVFIFREVYRPIWIANSGKTIGRSECTTLNDKVTTVCDGIWTCRFE